MSNTCPRCLAPMAADEVHEEQRDCDVAAWDARPDVSRGKPGHNVSAGSGTPELLILPIERIHVGDNVREDLGELDDLVASITSEGLLQPITVQRVDDVVPHQFLLVYGQRRLAACTLAGMTEIAAIVEPARAGVARPIAQLVENLQRRDLNPLEEAEAFRDIVATGLKQVELAERIGRSPAYVSNALRLLELDPEVRAMAEAGQISGSHAKALVAFKGPKQLEWAQRVIQQRMSSHELEQRIAQQQGFDADSRRRESEQADAKVETIARAIAAMGKKKVPLDAKILVRKPYYGQNSSGPTIKAIRDAGYTNVSEGTSSPRSDALGCDCGAWLVEVDYAQPHVIPACIDLAHTTAKHQADTDKRNENWERQKRVRARLGDCLTANARSTDQLTARIALWCVLGWQVKDWAAKWNAPVKPNQPLLQSLQVLDGPPAKAIRRTPWQTVMSLTDVELGQELAKALADRFNDHSEIKVDWEALEAELAGPQPPVAHIDPIDAEAAAERLATKRAARRAEMVAGLQAGGQKPSAIAAAEAAFDAENGGAA